jgi:hypothetical protein
VIVHTIGEGRRHASIVLEPGTGRSIAVPSSPRPGVRSYSRPVSTAVPRGSGVSRLSGVAVVGVRGPST